MKKNMKNISKRWLALFLVLMMCFSLLPTAAFAAEGDEDVADVPAPAPAATEPAPSAEEPNVDPEPAAPVQDTVEPEIEGEEEAPAEEPPAAPAKEEASVVAPDEEPVSMKPSFEAAASSLRDKIDGAVTGALDKLPGIGGGLNLGASTMAYDPPRTIYLYFVYPSGTQYSQGRVVTTKSAISGVKVLDFLAANFTYTIPSGYKFSAYKYREGSSSGYGSWSSCSATKKFGDTSYIDIGIALVEDHTHSYQWTSISNSQHQLKCPTDGATSGSAQSHDKSYQVSYTPATCNSYASTTWHCNTCNANWTETGTTYATHTWGDWYNNGNGKEQRDCNYGVHHEYRNIQTQQVTLTYMDRGVQYAKETYDKGTQVTIKSDCDNTAPQGKVFKGWNTKTDGSGYYWTGDIMTLNASTTLYAVWQQKMITVTWLDEDGNQIKKETIPEGGDYEDKYPNDDPSGTGYWGEPVTDSTTGNITIQWEEPDPPDNTVTVKWVNEDGTTVLDGPKTFYKGEAEPSYSKELPTKADDDDYTYEFARWDRSEDEDGNVTYTATYTPTLKPVDPVDPVDPKPEKVTITVEFVDEDGNPVGDPIVVEVDKDSEYDVTEKAETIPEGFDKIIKTEGDLTTGTADSNKKITVTVGKDDGNEGGEDPDPNPNPNPNPNPGPNPNPNPGPNPTPDDPTPDTPDTPPVVDVPEEDPPLGAEPDTPDEPVIDIPEEDPPLGDKPELPDEVEIPDERPPMGDRPSSDDTIDIPEEEIPMAEVPQTGDNTTAWLILAMFSGMGLAWLVREEEKNRRNAK